MTNTIQQALLATKERLKPTSPTPVADSEILLCHVLNCDRSYLYTWPEKILTNTQQQHLDSLIERRMLGEPVAYLTGQRAFWEFNLAVSAATLIPRPETELLVEQALLQIPLNASYDILDLGTGTGAVALAIAHERPSCHITAIEQSPRRWPSRHETSRLATAGISSCSGVSGFQPCLTKPITSLFPIHRISLCMTHT